MRLRQRLLLAAVVCGSLAFGSLAFADSSPQDIAQARELGGQAQAAFEAGNYAESEKLWLAGERLYPAPTLTLGLARTQAKLGKLVLAQESYKKIIREQGDAPNLSPAFKDALDSAKSEVGGVSARIASVVIVVEGPANPQVTIDGQVVSTAGLGLRRPVDPGEHTVKAEAPGYKPASTSFHVAEAGAADAKLVLEKAPDAPGGGAAKDNGGKATPKSEGGNKTLALAALGVGGAGLVFGTITGILAMGKHSDLESQCPDSRCPASVEGDLDSYKTMGTLSTIGFIVGGVGLVGGAVLWFTAPKASATATTATLRAPRRPAVEWQPWVSAGGGGITGRF